MTYILVAALFMALASYIPRVIPLVFCRKKVKSRFLKSFLTYMPYAVLSALTFPSVFYSAGDVKTAAAGTAVALILSFFKVNLAVVAVVCVAVVYGLSFII
jgi:branched-subunit amino acid transport protein